MKHASESAQQSWGIHVPMPIGHRLRVDPGRYELFGTPSLYHADVGLTVVCREAESVCW